MQVAVLTHERYELAESPQWLAGAGELQHVDIRGRAIVRHGEATRRRQMDADVGFALATASGGILAGAGLQVLQLEGLFGRATIVADVRHEPPGHRFNDACADPAGRVFAGTMSPVRRPGSAALYRLEGSGELRRVLPATISNGLDWNLDATVLYYVDSPAQRIDAIGYDVDTGSFGARRRFATIDREDGLPDGLAVDGDGGVWIALFGGGRIRRYTREGDLDLELALPVTNPTSLAFGVEDLSTLFVTSARHRLTPDRLRAEPLAGAVLTLRPGIRGREPALAR